MPSWNGAEVELGEAIEGTGDGRRWHARAGGRPALVIEASLATEGEAAQVGERLRRLLAHPDAALRPTRAWAREGREVWVATDPAEGTTLDNLLAASDLTPREAAAVAWQVLTALQALHEAGLAHGRVTPAAVEVDAAGAVRLGDHWFNTARRATADDLLADIEAAGAIGCAALGLGLHADAHASPSPAERDAPALTRTLRAIAGGASGANVSGARMALSATAGSFVESDGLSRASRLLAARVRGEEVPVEAPAPAAPAPPRPVTPPVSAQPVAAVAPPEPPRIAASPAPQRYVATPAELRDSGRGFDAGRLALPLMIAGGAILALLALWLIVTAIRHATATPVAHSATPRPTARVTARATPSAAPTPAPTPRPSAPPAFGPASAPPIQSVELRMTSSCGPGGACGVEVTVHTSSAGSSTSVAWTVKAFDSCTGSVTDVATNSVTEQPSWTSVIGDNTVSLPAGRGLQLVAVTTAPTSAASPPVPVASAAC